MKLTMSADGTSMVFDVEHANTPERLENQHLFLREVVRLAEMLAVPAVVATTPRGLHVAANSVAEADRLFATFSTIVTGVSSQPLTRVGARIYSVQFGAGIVLRATRWHVTVEWDEPSAGTDKRAVVAPHSIEPFLETHCGRCDEILIDGRCLPCAELCAEQIHLAQDGRLWA